VRTRNGRLQLRLAPPDRMTRAAEQAFFRALSASANVRLAAAAAGFAHSSFYARKRAYAPFAREMRFAIAIAGDRLEAALTQRALQLFGEGAPWRGLAPDDNPLPPMTVSQCIHLVTLHRIRDRPRAGADGAGRWPAPFEETGEGLDRAREAAVRASHYEATGSWRFPDEPPASPSGLEAPALPPLHLVTGWSKANPDRARVTYNPDLPLFGGWRIGDWKKKRAMKG
jgi:hypothetical protein